MIKYEQKTSLWINLIIDLCTFSLENINQNFTLVSERNQEIMGSRRDGRSRSRSRSRDRLKRRDNRDGRRDRSRSRDRDRSRSKERRVKKEQRGRDRQEAPIKNESEQYGLRVLDVKKEETNEEPKEKEGINLGLSGALTADVNTFNGVVIKYAEPPEARLPKRRWRFYVFKGEEVLPTLHLHRQSAYLIGRDRKVFFKLFFLSNHNIPY